MYLLGFDIGSSSIKAALVEAQTRRVVAVQSFPENAEMGIQSPQPNWAEQDPEMWWQNLCKLSRQILKTSGIAKTDVRAIGIGYQMHGLVAVGDNDRPLRPAIIWCDSRAVGIGREAFRTLGESFCLGSLLNSPGNFTASKLRWLLENEPQVFQKIKKIMLPGDYIALRLTGQALTTVSGLSEGIFWDFQKNEVSEKLLNHFQISLDLLPETAPTFSTQGKLTATAAEATGLHTGVEVTYRAGDQPNNALALNVVRTGEIAATGGTSGVVFGVFDRPIFDKKSRINAFAHVNHSAESPKIGALLCINGAGSAYAWMKNQVAEAGFSFQKMEQQAAAIPVGSDGVAMLPFGNGAERMLENRSPGAQILNLQFNRHDRSHLVRAALEGVAFSFVFGIEILKEIGLQVGVLRVGNDNLFQSKIFSTTIASLLGSPIEVVETTGAVGAARAAGLAVGAFGSLDEALSGVRPTAVFAPENERAAFFDAFENWKNRLIELMDG